MARDTGLCELLVLRLCHAREPLYLKGAVIAWWLQSTSAQNNERSCLKG